MPVYNTEQYVSDAIKSILNQTYTNFEFIIIDDGSSDNSPDIINKFKDSRIRFFQNQKNLGTTETRNLGLKLSNGKYIAKMDSDDISITNRFEIQLNLMSKQYVAVGSSMIPFNKYKEFKKLSVYKNNFLTILDPYFSNPTVLMDNEFINKNKVLYQTEAEDFFFWTELFRKNNYNPKTFFNSEKPLVYYRISDNQYTKWNYNNINKDASFIRRKSLIDFLKFYGIEWNFFQKDYINLIDIESISNVLNELKTKIKQEDFSNFQERLIFYFLLSIDRSKLNFNDLSWKYLKKLEGTQILKFLNFFLLNKKYIKRY